MRVLFVNHSLKGGSTRSLRELIRHAGVDADMVLSHREATMTDDEIRAYFGPRLGKIIRWWLPFELCYKGRPTDATSALRVKGLAAMWWTKRGDFYDLAKDYDVVHLNSVVLHPVVREDLPCIVHVREIVDRDLESVASSLQRARGVIFIDEATRAPFRNAGLRRAVVINNPVDMTGVDRPPADAAARIGGDPAALTVFMIIGILIPEKGVDRVIRAFRAMPKDARLLVVGEGPQEAALREVAAGDARVVFWGQEVAVDGLFALADFVLRGEAYPCVGRTIYEALYAGCGVIVPGSEADHTLFEYERFASRVTFYPPGDEVALTRAFDALAGTKLANKRGESNAEAHVAAFDAFVRRALGRA